MSPPTTAHRAKLARLRVDVADRVSERACLIYDGCPGTTWDEADARAYLEESTPQRALFGGEP